MSFEGCFARRHFFGDSSKIRPCFSKGDQGGMGVSAASMIISGHVFEGNPAAVRCLLLVSRLKRWGSRNHGQSATARKAPKKSPHRRIGRERQPSPKVIGCRRATHNPQCCLFFFASTLEFRSWGGSTGEGESLIFGHLA